MQNRKKNPFIFSPSFHFLNTFYLDIYTRVRCPSQVTLLLWEMPAAGADNGDLWVWSSKTKTDFEERSYKLPVTSYCGEVRGSLTAGEGSKKLAQALSLQSCYGYLNTWNTLFCSFILGSNTCYLEKVIPWGWRICLVLPFCCEIPCCFKPVVRPRVLPVENLVVVCGCG